ncbi:hypothetical protein OOK31_16495 [Streptomyces sp. NBC_00249]|uniref:hypothetical protein n=1 Tax=Streptomyces sp. NBC_00249 TaxID=2975690 RepID=UPI002254E84D|nr:hypothetical protein [Streptomyces sp. NBC_00249]MCX5195484.1 hypothetical protein [Streptomyces sp. NBC_00249]
MNVSREPSAASSTPYVSLVFGLLAVAVSLISVALTLADGLGAGPTAALIAADLVLVAAMGALAATLRPEPARRSRDERLLDELEPLLPAEGPASGPAGGGR